jgi:imidazolonepropionase-like amidohydrolase
VRSRPLAAPPPARALGRPGHSPALVAALAAGLILVAACAQHPPPSSPPPAETQAAFLENYARYCGAAYDGRTVMVDLGDDHPLDGARLTMTLERCTPDEVRIPFRVDDDRSRTWILSATDRGLHLAHDHRYEDGTEHAANFYGGYADGRGTPTKQLFPADSRTIAERPTREMNVWSKEFDLDHERYHYRLYLGGELRYEAEFDLSRPRPVAVADRQHAPPVAFIAVSVVPMDSERVLRDQTVIVRDGTIAEIGPSATVRVPDDAIAIDGAGRYLMPGLTEMHAHIPSPQQGEDVIERTLFLYLSNGVTTIRGMLGHPRHLELRRQAEQNQILSPRIYTSGPSLNGNSAPTPDVATRMVEEQHAAGYDLLKLHPGLTRPVFDAIVTAANRLDMPFAGHVSGDVGLDAALAAGQTSIDHLDGYVEAMAGLGGGFSPEEGGFFGLGFIDRIDLARIPALAEATRDAGVWNVPTQSLMEHLLADDDPETLARRPEMRYMPPATVAQWAQTTRNLRSSAAATPDRVERYIDARRRLIRALHEAGAGLALGSDAPQIWNVPGFSIHHELRMLVESGLTPYQALATGTHGAATYFGTTEWGTIAPGRAADLILLESNPLEDIANAASPAGVMVRGRWLSAAEIEAALEAIAAAVRE